MYDMIIWWREQLVQLIFRLLAKGERGSAISLIKRRVRTIGDTRIIEKSHGSLVDKYRGITRNIHSTVALHADLTRSTELKSRHLRYVDVVDWESPHETGTVEASWNAKYNSTH